jgi:hypothetical protein
MNMHAGRNSTLRLWVHLLAERTELHISKERQVQVHWSGPNCIYKKKNLRLKTNNKSTGEAQSANYLKSRTDYTTQCQLVNAKQETTNSIGLHKNINKVTDPQKLHARALTKWSKRGTEGVNRNASACRGRRRMVLTFRYETCSLAMHPQISSVSPFTICIESHRVTLLKSNW